MRVGGDEPRARRHDCHHHHVEGAVRLGGVCDGDLQERAAFWVHCCIQNLLLVILLGPK